MQPFFQTKNLYFFGEVSTMKTTVVTKSKQKLRKMKNMRKKKQKSGTMQQLQSGKYHWSF